MKTKSIVILSFVAIFMLIASACKKEGPQGPPGVDGNANVIASPWITPHSWDGCANDWYFDVSNAAITQDIVETGVILAYISAPGDLYQGTAVRPLPAYAIGVNWDFLVEGPTQTSLGFIEFSSDATAMPATTNIYFRFILIPSSSTLSLKSGSTNGLRKSELQNMPYKDVCKLLGIRE